MMDHWTLSLLMASKSNIIAPAATTANECKDKVKTMVITLSYK